MRNTKVQHLSLDRFPLIHRLFNKPEQPMTEQAQEFSTSKRVRKAKALPPYNKYHPWPGKLPFGGTMEYLVSSLVNLNGKREVIIKLVSAKDQVYQAATDTRAKWMTKAVEKDLLRRLSNIVKSPPVVPDSVKKIIQTAHEANPNANKVTGEQVKTVNMDTAAPKPRVLEVGDYALSELTKNLAAEAEVRKQIFQTQAAVNIGIGIVLKGLNQTKIRITPKNIQEFTSLYRVEQTNDPDGGFTLELIPR